MIDGKPHAVRLGLPSAEDDDLPPLPQAPQIRYLYVKPRLPVWVRCVVMAAVGAALACLGDTLLIQCRQDPNRWVWLPRPDLAPPLQLVCDPACGAPTYCDSSTGRCVADAAIAIDPTPRRAGRVEYP